MKEHLNSSCGNANTPRNRIFTLVELVTLVFIIGIVAVIVDAPGTKAKAIGCARNIDLINSQIELYYANTGAYPATLDVLTGDVNYFPDGPPTCPVTGTTYSNILVNNRINTTGHAH